MKIRFLVLFIISIAFVSLLFLIKPNKVVEINSFEDCVNAGNAVMESYPPRCSANGQTYTQDIGNELEKADLIKINHPRPNGVIQSPIAITGQASGIWFFEGSFPIELYDADGNKIGSAIALANGDWMTSEFVEFNATLDFAMPTTTSGQLIFKKDNPSGLFENDDELRMPVKFY